MIPGVTPQVCCADRRSRPAGRQSVPTSLTGFNLLQGLILDDTALRPLPGRPGHDRDLRLRRGGARRSLDPLQARLRYDGLELFLFGGVERSWRRTARRAIQVLLSDRSDGWLSHGSGCHRCRARDLGRRDVAPLGGGRRLVDRFGGQQAVGWCDIDRDGGRNAIGTGCPLRGKSRRARVWGACHQTARHRCSDASTRCSRERCGWCRCRG